MKTGSLEGFVDRTWQICHDSGELAAAATSYTISGLDGDTDVKYRLIVRGVAGVTNSNFLMRFNNDTGTNYGIQRLSGQGTNVLAARGTATAAYLNVNLTTPANGSVNRSDTLIQAKSGSVRTLTIKDIGQLSGTTVDIVSVQGWSWNNTADNITSIVVLSDQASGIGIGSRFILLKEVHVPSGLRTGELDIRGTLKGAWQEVYRHTVTGAAETAITVSGLKGNTTDQILRVRVRGVNGYSGAVNAWIKPNNCGAGSCGYQSVAGNDATPSAYRSTSEAGFFCGGFGALNQVMHSETIIYAKSGFVRTAIQEVLHANGTVVYLFGSSLNDTSNEIISLVISGDQIGTLGIGTEIVIERLNL